MMGAFYFGWEGEPITIAQWVRLFEDERHIGDDELGDVRVSTVWIGLDHGLGLSGPPLIFETMIFGGELDGHIWRYSSETEARAGHARAVGLVLEMVKEVP